MDRLFRGFKIEQAMQKKGYWAKARQGAPELLSAAYCST
jgi:hypothetical protein